MLSHVSPLPLFGAKPACALHLPPENTTLKNRKAPLPGNL